MESDLQVSMASKAGPSEKDKKREEMIRWVEEMYRETEQKTMEMNRKMDEMSFIDQEKIIRRRRERLMRHYFRRKKKNSKSKDSESFTSDSDDEEVKRLMEKAIRETLLIEDSKAAGGKIRISKDEKIDEKMFPRRRGRLIRYVRRHSSKSPEEDFQIEFHHLQLPSDDEDDSDEETNNETKLSIDLIMYFGSTENMTWTLTYQLHQNVSFTTNFFRFLVSFKDYQHSINNTGLLKSLIDSELPARCYSQDLDH